MASVRGTTVATKDGKIHYLTGGEGEPLVLVHGMGSSCRSWQNVQQVLSNQFRIYALCITGLGDSEKPKANYTFEQYAQSIFNFMDAVGVAQASVIGHSLGGMLLAQMAATNPKRVRKAVVEGCPAWTAEQQAEYGRNVDKTTTADGRAKPYTLEDLKALYYAPTREILEPFNADRERAGTWYRNLARAIAAFDPRKAIRMVTAPTLVVFGETERYRDQEQYFLDHIPGAQLKIIPRSGHTPHQENPQQFLDAVLPFLEAKVKV